MIGYPCCGSLISEGHHPDCPALELARERVAEIDTMFEEATGWGSWMVMAANERESLATRFSLPQRFHARCGGKKTD